MKISVFVRQALGIGGALALLSGCGGSQPPFTTSGALPQNHSLATRTDRGSWMLPKARTKDLLYYSAGDYSKLSTWVFSYPQGNLVGVLDVGGSLCSDSTGNVWIAGSSKAYGNAVVEYAHGGDKPIKVLKVPNYSPYGCSVDPATGNLAVVVGSNSVGVYKAASGSPQIYAVNLYPTSSTYDSNGNLFVLGDGYPSQKNMNVEVAGLLKGETRFHRIWGYYNHTGYAGEIRWDGTHLAISTSLFTTPYISRYVLRGKYLKGNYGPVYYAWWIDHFCTNGSRVALSVLTGHGYYAPVYLFHYPKGGYAIKTIGEGIAPAGGSLTISVAPN
jgi:hypothetical protein